MPALDLHYQLDGHVLDNGLRLVVNPDPSSPGVAVNLWYQVGSRDEVVDRTGFAHLFEHLMFQGTWTGVESGEHLAAIQAAGGTANATTSFDRTNYFETTHPGALELALSIEALNSGSLPPTAHLDQPDPRCDLDYIPLQARHGCHVEAVMSNSFAFGGSNAVLAFRAADSA